MNVVVADGKPRRLRSLSPVDIPCISGYLVSRVANMVSGIGDDEGDDKGLDFGRKRSDIPSLGIIIDIQDDISPACQGGVLLLGANQSRQQFILFASFRAAYYQMANKLQAGFFLPTSSCFEG